MSEHPELTAQSAVESYSKGDISWQAAQTVILKALAGRGALYFALQDLTSARIMRNRRA